MIDLIRNTSNIEESIVVVFSQGKQFYRYYLFLYQIGLFFIVCLGIYATMKQLMTFQILLIFYIKLLLLLS